MLEDAIFHRIDFHKSALEPPERLVFREQTIEEFPAPAVVANTDPIWQTAIADEKVEIGPGASGCWLAHFYLWESIAKSPHTSSPHVILEADAGVTDYGLRYLSQILSTMKRRTWDLVHLGRGLGDDFSPVSRNSQSPITIFRRVLKNSLLNSGPVYLNGFSWRTHAYVLFPRTASILWQKGIDLTLPVDQWLLEQTKPLNLNVKSVVQPAFLPMGGNSLIDLLGR